MNAQLLHTFAVKLSAISFIVLILIAHAWLLMSFLGQAPHAWLQLVFIASVVGALSGGALLVLLKLSALLREFL